MPDNDLRSIVMQVTDYIQSSITGLYLCYLNAPEEKAREAHLSNSMTPNFAAKTLHSIETIHTIALFLAQITKVRP